jgi:hypothetical protein
METQKMPPEIAKAIVKVMGEVKKLGKDADNKHGGYKYVSVDQFFDQIGALMHGAGIFVVVDETGCETAPREATDKYGNVKVSTWLTSHYDISIYHDSGAQFGPVKRTIQVQATGPQSYGSAISYVEKYFLRSLFKIPTGEQDADADAQEGLPAQPRRVPTPPKPPQTGLSQDESQLARDMLLSTLEMAATEADLIDWQENNKATIGKLMEADRQAVRDAYGDHRQALKGKAAA